MSEEDILRKTLDRIHENSTYGLNAADQTYIANIIHSYIVRGIDCDYDIFNSPPPPIYIGPVKIKTLKERLEETKMKATSVQVINNVKDMNVTFEKSPLEETRIILSVSTDDDTYEINCSGPGCEKFLRKLNFVPTKEYDYIYNQLMSREKEIHKLKEEYEEQIDVLQRKYNLEREANEAQHKFFRQYAGNGTEIEFNYAIGDTDEVTYVIVDKEEYESLKNFADLVAEELKKANEKILELEKLKTPTIENFADEEPSSRRDILRCAEKCVCGKREQDYGTPESNFQLIADLWNQYLFKEHGAKEVFGIGPMDVSMMMALMKIARIRNGGGSGDSFVDLAGYAACGGELWHLKKETNGDSN